MFLAMRITNGIVATLAGLLALLFLLTFGLSSSVLTVIIIKLGAIALLFVGDLFIRKRKKQSDVIFSFIWSILFCYMSIIGLQMLAYENIQPELGGYLVFGITVCLLYVLPLVLNGTYLLRLAMPKKDTA